MHVKLLKQLQNENLSAEDRARIAEQLQKLKADLSRQEAEAEIDAIEQITKADEKAQKERLRNLKKWMQTASQVVGTIGDLVSSIYEKNKKPMTSSMIRMWRELKILQNRGLYLKRKQKHVSERLKNELKQKIKLWKNRNKKWLINKPFGIKQ